MVTRKIKVSHKGPPKTPTYTHKTQPLCQTQQKTHSSTDVDLRSIQNSWVWPLLMGDFPACLQRAAQSGLSYAPSSSLTLYSLQTCAAGEHKNNSFGHSFDTPKPKQGQKRHIGAVLARHTFLARVQPFQTIGVLQNMRVMTLSVHFEFFCIDQHW